MLGGVFEKGNGNYSCEEDASQQCAEGRNGGTTILARTNTSVGTLLDRPIEIKMWLGEGKKRWGRRVDLALATWTAQPPEAKAAEGDVISKKNSDAARHVCHYANTSGTPMGAINTNQGKS